MAMLLSIFWGSVGAISKDPIIVGVLHSLTGTMAISEIAVMESTLLAIDEINRKGGILGRHIAPIVIDGASDWPTFAREAERLITQGHVDVIFGCWTSACRKSVKPVIEMYNSLFVYPVQYEGLELSSNILYLGSAPNQQIIPAIKWSFDNLGKRFFLVGSDYIFPHTANAIIHDMVKTLKGEIVGEEYFILGSQDVKGVIEKIKRAKPDLIINTINGDTNPPFFKARRQVGLQNIPVISFSVSENEIPAIGLENIQGDYAVWNYFQSLPGAANQTFVRDFKKRYGANRSISDPMEAAYFGVYLWAQAVERAGTPSPPAVIRALKMHSFNAPEGVVSVDAQTMHTWKSVRIGKVNSEGQFEVVWSSKWPIRPVPYPPSRSIREWNQFLQHLYESWGHHWANTSTSSPKVEEEKARGSIK